MKSQKLTRRCVLRSSMALAGAASVTSLAAPAISQGLRTIKLTLPWLANGSTLYTYVAKHQGFFRKRGLEVNISRGYGSVAAAQAVAAHEFDFGVVFAGGTILGAARGLPLVALSTLGYDATMGITLRADSPITKPKDLEGKKLGTVVTSAESPYWPAFAKQAGLDLQSITMVQMDNRVLEQSVANKQVDGSTAIGTSSIPVMYGMREPCRFMLWKSAGVELYGGQIVTVQDTFANNKSLCRDVVDALTEGLLFAMKDPAAGVDIFIKEVPEIGITTGGRENAKLSQGLMHYTMLAPEAEEHALGYADLQKASAMITMVMEYGVPKDAKRPPVETLFSNDLIGDAKLSAAEWERAKQNVAEYARILGA